MPRTSALSARPRTLGLIALFLLLLVGAYAVGSAVASNRNLPPPAAPVILGGTSDSPRPTTPNPAASQKARPKSPAPKVRTNAPAPPVVKPTPRKVDRVVVGDRDDDDDRDDRDDDDDEADDD